MNRRQLQKLGVPDECVGAAVTAIQRAAGGGLRGRQVKEAIRRVLESPEGHLQDEHFGDLARRTRAAS